MPTQGLHLTQPKYRPDIDGLRAVAVLAVVAFHAFPNWVRGGFIGVDIFFVISGYLISTILFESLDKGTFSFSEFYFRRIKRIFPSLLVVLIACLAFGWFVLLADEYKQLGKHIAGGAGFISNFILWNEAGYFDSSAESKPLLHLWSLGIEEQFYIVWPVLLLLAWKFNFNFLTITTILAIATFILNLKGVKQDVVATFYSPQTRFWELLSGSFVAWVVLYKKQAFANIVSKINGWFSQYTNADEQKNITNSLANTFSFVGTFLLIYGFGQINKELSFPGMWALVPVLGATLIIISGSKAWVNRTILSNNVVIWFGLISFPLYLWHWPLLSFARIIEGGVLSRDLRIAAVILAIVFAWLTYELVERPIRFGDNSKLKVILLIVLMSIVGFAGYNTYKRDGLKFRNKVQSSSVFITNLTMISNVYDYFNYTKVLRDGVCHSVSLDAFRDNNCLDIREKNIFIWGDSYAASIYDGMNYVRNKEFSNVGITQMTDGNGPPFYTSGKTDDGKTLIEANNNRLKIVSEVKPNTILITWLVDGINAVNTKDETILQINKTINKILTVSPNSKVIVIGPFPRWQDTLRKQLLNYYSTHKMEPPVYMNHGLVKKDRDFDLFLSQNLRRKNVVYISSYDSLCNADGCLTRVSDNVSDLTAIDWGHLTSAGSVYLVEKIKNLVFDF